MIYQSKLDSVISFLEWWWLGVRGSRDMENINIELHDPTAPIQTYHIYNIEDCCSLISVAPAALLV